MITARFEPAGLASDWEAALDRLAADDVVGRIWAQDHTVIQDDPVDCANRFGWLEVMADSRARWGEWAAVADAAVERVDHVIVLGMGGSSLFPEVLASTFEAGEGYPEIRVLDTTDPGAVARLDEECSPDRTMCVVSSKSGSTIETRSHLEYFWKRMPDGNQFIAVTDPGSDLEQLARSRGFFHIAHGIAEIGGRYSALSAFGLVPAALLGLEGDTFIETAEEAAAVLGSDTPTEQHLGCQLGSLIAVAAQAGRPHLTFLIDERFATFGLWIEQLIAESTGKHGVGILPIIGETADAPSADTRLYVVIGEVEQEPPTGAPAVYLTVEEPQDLGAQIFLWEFAVTVAGIVLGINPFDQPDVESAKKEAREVLAGRGTFDAVRSSSLDAALAAVQPTDALVIAAFVDPALEPVLQSSRRVLGDRAGVPTTLGLGPRFLHSTGQLHKGGPDRIVVVQVVSDDETDLDVPGTDYTFSRLKQAQADGDLAALEAAGKRAFRVGLHEVLAANA